MSQHNQIAICGGGLGGLTAALALTRRGFDVTVYEQTERLAEVGAGLQLAANATRVFAELGVLDRIAALASVPQGKRVRLWDSGESWKLFDLGAVSQEKYGSPYLMVHRADLQSVLIDAFAEIAPGRLVLSKRLTGIDQTGDRPTLKFADGTQASADVVVGADGVHSVVRRELFGATEATFSGCMAWRGVVDAGTLPDALREPQGTNWIGPHGHVIQLSLIHI